MKLERHVQTIAAVVIAGAILGLWAEVNSQGKLLASALTQLETQDKRLERVEGTLYP